MSNAYRNLLIQAQREGYAIPAFNYTDIWEFLAITEAAEELNAPVYAASAKVTIDSMGLDRCGAIGALEHRKSGGYLYNHLDHCVDVNVCKSAVDAGYHSVMFDGSALPIDENISCTCEVVAYAKKKGVLTEAEVGQILGRNDESTYCGGEHMATMQDCISMVETCGVDSLAIGIGNQHGFYCGEPKLNIPLLAEVHKKLDIPLVLHGGSGLADDVVRECIQNGIAKVNVGTEIHHAYRNAIAKYVKEEPADGAITSIFLPAKEAMKEVIRHWIRLCGAEGKRC